MLTHQLAYFEIKKYYQNKHKFKDAHSKNNLAKIMDGVYEINLD